MKYTGKQDVTEFLEFLKMNNYPMKPCSEIEITSLLYFGGKQPNLPESYLQFMRYAGNGIQFFIGSDYKAKEVAGFNEYAFELLEENGVESNLTDNDFVFFMHQGYQFYFFKLDEGDDPPIYFFCEGYNDEQITRQFETFTEFLIGAYHALNHFAS